MRNKRVAAALAAICLTLLCAGCVGSVRLNDRAIVQALGIDAQDGAYHVTMQVLSAASVKSPSDNASPSFVNSYGDTLSAAMANAARDYGRQMFLGGLQVVVFGEDTARDGIGESLSFLNKLHQIPPTLPLAVSRGKAGELITAAGNDPALGGKGLLNLLESARKGASAPTCRLMDAVAGCAGEFSAAMPVLESYDDQQSQEAKAPDGGGGDGQAKQAAAISSNQGGGESEKNTKRVRANGTAVFNRDRLEALLSEAPTRGLLLLQNDAVSMVVKAQTGSGRAAAATHSQKAKISVEMIGDNPVFLFKLDVQASLIETQAPGFSSMDGAQNEKLALLFRHEIEMDIESAVYACMRNGYDPLGLGLLLRRDLPDFLSGRLDGESVEDILKNAGYEVRVTLKLDRSGSGA